MKKLLASVAILSVLVGASACGKKAPVVDPTVAQRQLDRAHAAIEQAKSALDKATSVEADLREQGLIPDAVHAKLAEARAKAVNSLNVLEAKLPEAAAEVMDAAVKAVQSALNEVADKLESTGIPRLVDIAAQVRVASVLVAFII